MSDEDHTVLIISMIIKRAFDFYGRLVLLSVRGGGASYFYLFIFGVGGLGDISNSYLNCTFSRGASKKGALHSTLMTCCTWAPFSIVESIGLAWTLRHSSSKPPRDTFDEKFFRLVEDLLPKNTPIRPVYVCECVYMSIFVLLCVWERGREGERERERERNCVCVSTCVCGERER